MRRYLALYLLLNSSYLSAGFEEEVNEGNIRALISRMEKLSKDLKDTKHKEIKKLLEDEYNAIQSIINIKNGIKKPKNPESKVIKNIDKFQKSESLVEYLNSCIKSRITLQNQWKWIPETDVLKTPSSASGVIQDEQYSLERPFEILSRTHAGEKENPIESNLDEEEEVEDSETSKQWNFPWPEPVREKSKWKFPWP